MIAYVLAAHRLYRSQIICVTTFQVDAARNKDLMGRFHIVDELQFEVGGGFA